MEQTDEEVHVTKVTDAYMHILTTQLHVYDIPIHGAPQEAEYSPRCVMGLKT